MTTTLTAARIDFIESLELAGPNPRAWISEREDLRRFRLDRDLAEGEPAGYVDAGSLVSVSDRVPAQLRQDVLNSTLLAQLAANHDYDREKETQAWYGRYREVLENVGWVIQNFSFTHQKLSGQTVRLDKTALAIVAAAASGNELEILAATIEALGHLPKDDGAVKLFENNGSKNDNGNFQLSTATLDRNGNVQMSLGAFYFEASHHEGRFLFFSWNVDDLKLYAGAQNVVLDEQIYSTVRKAIVKKLGDKAKTFVSRVKIS